MAPLGCCQQHEILELRACSAPLPHTGHHAADARTEFAGRSIEGCRVQLADDFANAEPVLVQRLLVHVDSDLKVRGIAEFNVGHGRQRQQMLAQVVRSATQVQCRGRRRRNGKPHLGARASGSHDELGPLGVARWKRLELAHRRPSVFEDSVAAAPRRDVQCHLAKVGRGARGDPGDVINASQALFEPFGDALFHFGRARARVRHRHVNLLPVDFRKVEHVETTHRQQTADDE